MSKSLPLVLIVDDTATNTLILDACLKGEYQTITASDGEQALKIANQDPKPDLILLDIEMPGMDGYQVCRILKSEPATKDIPVIFVTAKLDVKDEEKGFALGAVDYITKPIHPPLVLARARTQITLKQQRDQLQKMALYDQLSGLYNRHYLLDAAKKKMSMAIRHDVPISVLMIDIDHFKSINDEYGHPTGDVVIKAIAKLLNKSHRKEDIAARFGGEEFVVVLSHCDLKDATTQAEKLREKIEKLNPSGIKITASIGLSNIQNDEDSFSDILARADKALYSAKSEGRNQVALG